MHKYVLVFFMGMIFISCNNSDSKPPKQTSQANKLPDIPKSLIFFNQKILINDSDVQERLDREILINTYFQSSTSLQLKRAQRYFPQIEKILKEENVPLDFKYLCVIESGLSNAESPTGALGFWQFMPFTAEDYQLKITEEIDERLDLEKSTRAACHLIKKNHSIFNDWVMACAAYNRGAGGLQEDMQFQKVSHFFDTEMNSETSRYVFRIMAMKLIMENPSSYGYHIPKNQCYDPHTFNKIKVTKNIENLAQWSKDHGTTRKNIRILNPWILGNKLTSKSLPCTLKIPLKSGTLQTYSHP